jgi:hypothetical protein
MFELTHAEMDTTRYALQIFLDSFESSDRDTIANFMSDIEIARELKSRLSGYLSAYCEHGTYVGGAGADYMCGHCEAL